MTELRRHRGGRMRSDRVMWQRRFPYEQYNNWSQDLAEKRRWTEALEKQGPKRVGLSCPTAPSVRPRAVRSTGRVSV